MGVGRNFGLNRWSLCHCLEFDLDFDIDSPEGNLDRFKEQETNIQGKGRFIFSVVNLEFVNKGAIFIEINFYTFY